uniref:Uncharacterized protein n=1 Tax=Arundo donax TaxID=35708 RepID=A0A0A8Z9X2_ARUDO
MLLTPMDWKTTPLPFSFPLSCCFWLCSLVLNRLLAILILRPSRLKETLGTRYY